MRARLPSTSTYPPPPPQALPDNANKQLVKALRSALLAGEEDKAILAYTTVDKAGNSLDKDLHPSLPLDGDGENTPLHYAAAASMGALLGMFIEHGGSPNTVNKSNQTCLHAACGGLQQEVAGGELSYT